MSARSQSAAMEGSGWYNRHSSMQAAGNERAMAYWKDALEKVPVGGENIVIADYGCSQGLNSMKPINAAIDVLRRHVGAERPVEVYHNDLPSNDFGSLFQVIAGEPSSYMAAHGNAFPFAIGRSYFEPILPPASVHAAWNSWTIQWMSKKAADAPDHVFGGMSGVAEVRAAVAGQQAADWGDFLNLRSRELRPGGRLLSIFPACTPERRGWEYLGGELWEAVLDIHADGLIELHETHRVTIPTGVRSLADVRAPFRDSGRFAGLEIEHAEVLDGPDMFWEDLQRTGDVKYFASGWAGMARGFAGPTIANALDETRDRSAIIDAIFQRYEARLAANPQRHEHYFAVVVLAKVGER
jgi:S-adenosylmethionine-dependent carboxyl methyltransferase